MRRDYTPKHPSRQREDEEIRDQRARRPLPAIRRLPREFACPYCGKTFGTLEGMMAHVSSQHVEHHP